MTKDKIIIAGDIHGDVGLFAIKLRRNQIENAHIIHVGDFGIGFFEDHEYPKLLKPLHKFLAESNSHLYVIRGNHDDPSYFNTRKTMGGYDNIELLPDYTVLELLGKKILLVGGAISIDRTDRYYTSIPTWWRNETFYLNENFNYDTYDAVVTHTRPPISGLFGINSFVKSMMVIDKDLERDLKIENEDMDKLYQLTKPKHWFFGHFHESATSFVENTKFRCVDCHEAYMYHYEEQS
jgi:UDP-2,3-diacylglucosamine pyrophosphatase LpxH